MIRILNAESANYSREARDILRSLGKLDEYSLTRPQLLACIANYDVLIVRLGFKVDREVIDAGKNLKAIVTATTGLDHIDVAYAEQHSINVLSLRDQIDFLRTVPATAEHTWALLLALIRHIPWAFQSVLSGSWNRDGFRGHNLADKRLGIVGLGRIGEKVARFGLVFGMHVAACDPFRTDWLTDVEQYLTLPNLLKRTDILSLHLPLNAATQGMIGRQELATLPNGAMLINTSRGGIVDENALVEALQNRRLAGAALDVMEHEHDQHTRLNSTLLDYAQQHDNLLITPHIGGATAESMAMTEVFMANKLCDFLKLEQD